MPEADALSNFQFPKNKGLFVTFEDGDEYKLRVLTTDPVVTQKEFTSPDGEINLSTRFSFIVYNFTLGRAQILSAGATITKEIQRIHQDEDFGANIKKVDIKVTASGSKLSRKYTVNVLPKTETLTAEQVKECQAINLEEKVDGQRMSFYKPKEAEEHSYGVSDAAKPDEIAEVPEGEEFNLDDIPF